MNEQELTRALRGVAAEAAVPDADPRREAALLAAVDRAAAAPGRLGRGGRWPVAAFAAAAVLVATITLWPAQKTTIVPGVPAPMEAATASVNLPGAARLPAMGS